MAAPQRCPGLRGLAEWLWDGSGSSPGLPPVAQSQGAGTGPLCICLRLRTFPLCPTGGPWPVPREWPGASRLSLILGS